MIWMKNTYFYGVCHDNIKKEGVLYDGAEKVPSPSLLELGGWVEKLNLPI